MPAKLTRVALRNYRSIAECDVEIKGLTLLVGPNGSGKSNFLDALRFVKDLLLMPLDRALTRRGGIASVTRKLPGGLARSFEIKLDFRMEDGTEAGYSIEVGRSQGGSFILLEKGTVGGHVFEAADGNIRVNGANTDGPTSPDRAALTFGIRPEFAPLFRALIGFRFCAPAPKAMRGPRPVEMGLELAEDSSNAADVLQRMFELNRESFERVNAYLTAISPGVRRVQPALTDSYRFLVFTSSDITGWHLNSSEVSDGTLWALGVLLAVFQSGIEGSQVSLVGLEEPENNLHPGAMRAVFDALLEVSESTPILATTHSAELLDSDRFFESALVTAGMKDGVTIIEPVEETVRSVIRDGLYTAGDLLRNRTLAPARIRLGR